MRENEEEQRNSWQLHPDSFNSTGKAHADNECSVLPLFFAVAPSTKKLSELSALRLKRLKLTDAVRLTASFISKSAAAKPFASQGGLAKESKLNPCRAMTPPFNDRERTAHACTPFYNAAVALELVW